MSEGRKELEKMFVREENLFKKSQDGKFDIQIALDDFIEISSAYDKSEIEAKLRVVVYQLEKKLYWYKILLEGLEREDNRDKKIDEEIEEVWSSKE